MATSTQIDAARAWIRSCDKTDDQALARLVDAIIAAGRPADAVNVRIGVIITPDGRYGLTTEWRGQIDWSDAEGDLEMLPETPEGDELAGAKRRIIEAWVPRPQSPEAVIGEVIE